MKRLLIDVMAAGGVDLSRLERSLGLRVRRAGHGRYEVRGGGEPHWVDLFSAHHPPCDCGDHLWRESVCKHILAAMLREEDERVLHAVAELVRRESSVVSRKMLKESSVVSPRSPAGPYAAVEPPYPPASAGPGSDPDH